MLAYCAERLIVCARCSDSSHIVRSVVAVISVPPAIVGENFESTGAILEVDRVAGAKIMLKTVVGPDGSAESVAFRRLGAYQDHRLHVCCIRRPGIGDYRHVLHVLRIELGEFLEVVDLSSVYVDFRLALAEHFQFAAVVDHHRHVGQHIVGGSGYCERTALDVGHKGVAFHCGGRTRRPDHDLPEFAGAWREPYHAEIA